MSLTIPELAVAVGKSENYVRQHIFRRHLAVQRDGRNLHVTIDEATRWAHERQLPFDPPTHVRATLQHTNDRTARMTVLTLKCPGGEPCNLLTAVRHRRPDALGPWAKEPSQTWTSEALDHGLQLHSIDAPLVHCQNLVQDILDKRILALDGLRIAYALEPIPRVHRVYREAKARADTPLASPFSRHSAEIVEYWSFADEPRKLWLELLGSTDKRAPVSLSRLGVPLERLSDRVGNIMIMRAEDEVACDLWLGRDRSLRLLVEAENLSPGAYRATVWASHAEDEVLRQEFPVVRRMTAVPLKTDVDRIGFEVFRTFDGNCIDRYDEALLKQLAFQIKINSTSTMQYRNHQARHTKKLNFHGPLAKLEFNLDEGACDYHCRIRQLWLNRRVREQESAARKQRGSARFQPDEVDYAVGYLVKILTEDADRKAPIYLADPYFDTHTDGELEKQPKLKDIYLRIFSCTDGNELRVQCAREVPEHKEKKPWWSKYPEAMTDHVQVRSFRSKDINKENGRSEDGRTNGFHDRFLITPKREILVSNSFNGWANYGVTFATLPNSVYRAEAERLWGMELDSKSSELFVQKIETVPPEDRT